MCQRVKSKRKDGGEDSGRVQSESLRGDEKWMTLWYCRYQRRACRIVQISVENLNKPGLPNRNGWPQCHKMSSWQVRPSRLCQTEKKQSHQSRSPDREMGESRGERKPHLGEKEQGQSMESKESAPIPKQGRFQGGEEGKAKRVSLGEVGESMSK